jgi:squalene-hopene/tetraprenyl-beta-curcumene cyclase
MTTFHPTALLAVALSTTAFAAPPAPPPAAVKCAVPTVRVAPRTDPKVRESALRGLGYLARSSRAWTEQHRCFGCHVQAVTLEALSVGKKHRYAIDAADIDAMTRALKLGVTAGGHTTGIAFEGAAWARYDALVGNNHTTDLLRYARDLLQAQAQNGSIPDDDRRLPVTGGTLETTFQAAQTWRQAFARTADERWLPPMRRAEAFLASQSKAWTAKSDVYLQDVNFALLGLLASGVSQSETSAHDLVRALLARQVQDGGWGLDKQKSDAFATGQTIYTLKMAGFSDEDAVIARGMKYLTSRQDATSGAWRTYKSGQGGAEKAETMWAVLGLVTVDVTSISVAGIVDGQHVEPRMALTFEASDNQGGGVRELQLLLDDLPVRTECGAKMTHTLETAKMTPGKHIVDVVAVNGKGQESRRRFEVYAGDVFLTGVGAQFDERAQATTVSLRNIAPASEKAGAVELEVYSVHDGADAKPKTKVWSSARRGELGGLAFTWDGKGDGGKAQPRGRYVAKLLFRDGAGKVRQTESALFFHDSDAAQRASYGEVEGNISLRGGAGSANTTVELVDRAGRVVQSTRTTAQGN